MRRPYLLPIAVAACAYGFADTAAAAAPEEGPQRAAAQVVPTQGNTLSGSLALAESAEGVVITGLIQGLRPNAQFGFHVHEKGDCSAPDASSAGEHFNPTSQPHGDPRSAAHHAGDMLNVRSDSLGSVQIDTVVKHVSLRSGQSNDIFGRAIVLHRNADDYKTQPSGNSGARIGCAVIEDSPS